MKRIDLGRVAHTARLGRERGAEGIEGRLPGGPTGPTDLVWAGCMVGAPTLPASRLCLVLLGLLTIWVPPLWAGGGLRAGEAPKGIRIVYDVRGDIPVQDVGAEQKERRTRRVITVDPSGQRLLLLDFGAVSESSGTRRDPGESEGTGAPGDPGTAARGAETRGRAEGDARGTEGGDESGGTLRRKLILRMDLSPPVIYEILPGDKQYREHAGDLLDLQADRDIAEANERKLIQNYPEKDREAFYKRYWWLRPDGSREVKVVREQGETILGYDCEHLRVLENDREIIDAQIVREGQIPAEEGRPVPGMGEGSKTYYHLYRRLGAFSEEVLEKIRDVEGFPLRGRITVVTALPTQTLEFEARSLARVDVPPTAFELPPGAVKVDDVPENLTCAECGKAIESVEEAGAKGLYDGRWIYFCSEACGDLFARKRIPRTAPGPR